MDHSGPSLFFPQFCTHVSCAFDSRGLLRAAMIAADRLLLFHDGALCADAALCGDGALRVLRLCDLSDETRVAVVRSSGVWLADVTAPAMHVTHRRVFVPTLTSTSTSASSVHEAIDAAFVTRASLAVLFSGEAVVVEIPNDACDNSDGCAVLWRRSGSYGSLAVCRTNLHLAFALRSPAIEVFPLKVRGAATKAVESPMFSPTHVPPPLSAPGAAVAAHTFARRGVSASLGVYRAVAIAWHRVRECTILCVTCEHPKDRRQSIALFTLQSVPHLRCSHIRQSDIHDHDRDRDMDRDRNDHGCDSDNETLQLVPAGTIDIDAASPLAAQLVPNLSRTRVTASMSSRLEFLCVDSDGTVRTVSYRFGKQCQMGFAKGRSARLHCQQLLQPLIARFGDMARIDVLPLWKSRAVEFGTCTPQAEQLLGTRRYRILIHFANGLVATVMIDMLSLAVRVEAFLTLGSDDAPPRLAASRDGGVLGDPRLVLGVARDRVFVLSRQLCALGHAETRVVAIAPIAIEHREAMTASSRTVEAAEAESAAGAPSAEDSVRNFMEAKCPEKVRMLPALLRACGGDAGRLLTQLTAKYGPVDTITQSPPPTATATATAATVSTALNEVTREIYVEDVHTGPDGVCFATHATGGARRLWCVPLEPLESFAAANGELFVHSAGFPSTLPIQCAANPSEIAAPDTTGDRKSKSVKKKAEAEARDDNNVDEDEKSEYADEYDGEIHCKLTGNGSVVVCGVMLPDSPSLSLQPFNASLLLHAQALRLANNGVVLATIGIEPQGNEGHGRLLRLYGLSLLRDMRNEPRFLLELELYGAMSVLLRRNGEAFILRRNETTHDSCNGTAHAKDSAFIERWVRVAVDGTDGHEWQRHSATLLRRCSEPDIMHGVDNANATPHHAGHDKTLCATAMTLLPAHRNAVPPLGCELLVYTSPDGSCIHTCELPGVSDNTYKDSDKDDSSDSGVPCYHPASLLLLLSMGRGAAVEAIAAALLTATERAAASEDTQGHASYSEQTDDKAQEEMNVSDSARVLCRCVISGSLCERPGVADIISSAPISIPAPLAHFAAPLTSPDADSFQDVVPACLLARLAALLPGSRLAGLDSTAQLGLLCVIEGLRAARAGGDAAAARFFFLHRMQQLRRRLSAPDRSNLLPPTHAAALWAALSDAQPVLLEELFTPSRPLTWEDVDAAHVPLWLGATHALREIADRLARAQYQATHDVRECALMYCLARKLGVLAALCKAERDARLQAFFSRDFREARHQQAAAANGFAAIGKNQLLFGAAFFVLANDARSAAQVILQRYRSVSLALFVLRLAGDDGPGDMLWFAEQRQREAALCGPVDAWEAACLAWRAAQLQTALDAMKRSPATGAVDAVERIALLRYEGRRGGRRYSARIEPWREMQWILQTARLAAGEGLRIPAALLYANAREVLNTLREEGDGGHRAKCGGKANESKGWTGTAGRGATRFAADFNTGTLTFHGFDDDDDDDDKNDGNNNNNNNDGDDKNNDKNNSVHHDGNGHKDANAGSGALLPTSSHHTQAPNSTEAPLPSSTAATATTTTGGTGAHGDDDDGGPLHPMTVSAVELEMRFAARWLRGPKVSAKRGDTSSYSYSYSCSCCYSSSCSWRSAVRAAGRLTATVGRRAPLACVERDLAALARALEPKEQIPEPHAGHTTTNNTTTNNTNTTTTTTTTTITEETHSFNNSVTDLSWITAQVVMAATRLALVSVAEQNTDYALASALLTFDSVESVLVETRESTVSMASAAAYVRVVREALCRVRAMVDERTRADSPEPTDVSLLHSSSSLCGSHSSLNDEAQLRPMLLAWFAAYMHTQTITELREVAIRFSRAKHATCDARLRWLLACALCRATLRFDAAAEQLMACVVALRHLDDSLLTNPNAIFIEETQELRRGAQLLEANLCADPHDCLSLDSAGSVLLDLCVARAELFWQLPHFVTSMSNEVDTAAALLQSATHLHAAAHLLYGQLSDGAAATLRRMESAWLRRHHTHMEYREVLLSRGLCGPHKATKAIKATTATTTTTATDRLVLHQAHHAVCSVGFDQSTCDSLVWGTDAGVAVVHGYREILTGDNDAALLREQTERNIATAAFAALSACNRDDSSAHDKTRKRSLEEDHHYHNHHHRSNKECGRMEWRSDAAAPNSRRPCVSLAAHARVASHPYVPFFLARHGDDCVDLYSFSSIECAATFRCPGSYPVTDVSYSPNGRFFVVGLADGSVVGWRFALRPAHESNNGSSNDIGGSSSMSSTSVVAALRPLFSHRLLPPGGVTAALFCGTNSSQIAVIGSDAVTSGGTAAALPRRVVGVILIIDLVVLVGKVAMRCELPFAPDFAVYIHSLHSVLCVTTDARAAIYEIGSGRLCVIAPAASRHVVVTCIAVSRYDDLVALGIGDGHALLLRGSTLYEACREEPNNDASNAECSRSINNNNNNVWMIDKESSKASLMDFATRVEIAPTLSTRAGVLCLAFTPSVLLAGLADGKVVAATLVPAALRQLCTQ